MRRWTIGFTIFGAGLAGYGLYGIHSRTEFVRGAESARVRLTFLDRQVTSSFEDEEIGARDRTYWQGRDCYRTILFTTSAGQRVVWQSAWSSEWRTGWLLGSLVPEDEILDILYDPTFPDHFEFDSFGSLWLASIVCLAAGLSLLGLAVAAELGTPVPRHVAEGVMMVLRMMRASRPSLDDFQNPSPG